MIKTEELIISDLKIIGTGKEEYSPARRLIEIYSKDGALIATHDSQGNYSVENLVEFGNFLRSNPTMKIGDALIKWRVE